MKKKKVNRQYACEVELKHWKKAFFQIRLPASKVMAVNRLCEFAMEMRAYWPDTRFVSSGASNPPLTSMETITAIDRDARPTPEVIGDTFKMEAEHEPATTTANGAMNFSGVVEGKPTRGPIPSPFRMEVGAVEAGVAIPGVDERLIDVYGYCPNPRLLQGRFVDDHKPVSVWKGPRHWRLPQKILCRKDPTSPHYMPV